MSNDLTQSEKKIFDLVPELGDKIAQAKPATRKRIIDNLFSLMETAYQKGSSPKNSSKVKQRWFTIFGYLAQVSARIVGDLEYDQLLSELEELKKRVGASDVTRTRRTILSQIHGVRRSKDRKLYESRDTH